MPRLLANAIPAVAALGREASASVAIPDSATHVGFIMPRGVWPPLNPRAEKPEGDDVWRCEVWIQIGGEWRQQMAVAGPGGSFTFPDGAPVVEENWRVTIPDGVNRRVRVEVERWTSISTPVHIEAYP